MNRQLLVCKTPSYSQEDFLVVCFGVFRLYLSMCDYVINSFLLPAGPMLWVTFYLSLEKTGHTKALPNSTTEYTSM